MIEIFFWLAVFIVVYGYILYPLIIFCLAKSSAQAQVTSYQPPELPEITVVICAYNAENTIIDRLENIIAQNYPITKINIIVVSDGSTDNTNALIQSFNCEQLQHIIFNSNQGKAIALNQAMAQVTTPLVVFTDVRQTFESNALATLVKPFNDPNVGAVSGELIIRSKTLTLQEPEKEGLYWKYEKFIRRCESKNNSMVGVTGAIYALRSHLFVTMNRGTILDDMHIPLCAMKKGFRIVLAEKAFANDVESTTLAEEYWRKVRTLAGNYQLIMLQPWLINPCNNPLFFEFFSHKIVRLLIPFCLLTILLLSANMDGIFYQSLFVLQIALYLLAYIGWKFYGSTQHLPLLSTLTNFVMLNIAALHGAYKFITGKASSSWKTH
jgi:cellulose synthase/poly-beta-1,6-N-acetylglucosamine synthase-like glycosyltransferase